LSIIKNKDITNSQGEVVYTEEMEVGTLEVYEVQSDRAKARVISGADPAEGDTVKFQ